MYRFVSLGGLSRVVVVEVVVGSVIQLAHYACMQVDGEIKAPGEVLRRLVLMLKCVAVQRCYTTRCSSNSRCCVDLPVGANLRMQIFNPGVQMHLNTRVIVRVCVCLQPRQTVLTAAGSIGQASGDLLRQIGENETDERFQVRLQPPVTDSTELEDKMGRVIWFGLSLNRQACVLFRPARTRLNHRCYFQPVFVTVIPTSH